MSNKPPIRRMRLGSVTRVLLLLRNQTRTRTRTLCPERDKKMGFSMVVCNHRQEFRHSSFEYSSSVERTSAKAKKRCFTLILYSDHCQRSARVTDHSPSHLGPGGRIFFSRVAYSLIYCLRSWNSFSTTEAFTCFHPIWIWISIC